MEGYFCPSNVFLCYASQFEGKLTLLSPLKDKNDWKGVKSIIVIITSGVNNSLGFVLTKQDDITYLKAFLCILVLS
jgi:hypothetical protein